MTHRTQRACVERRAGPVGNQIAVFEYPGEEPAIVAMHGWPDNHRIYDRLVPYLGSRRTLLFDPDLSPDVAGGIAALFTNRKIGLIESGHWPPIESPETVAELMLARLASASPAA